MTVGGRVGGFFVGILVADHALDFLTQINGEAKEFVGVDLREGPALGAEFDEFIDVFFGMHVESVLMVES